MIHAPFTDEQVTALNAFQSAGTFHPFTCAADHERHYDLIATTDGWVCPTACGYTQTWAHEAMADADFLAASVKSFRKMFTPTEVGGGS